MAFIELTENRALPPTGQLPGCKAISKKVINTSLKQFIISEFG